ncbi:MAG: rod shape-determining protein [Lachnospiraceae bacterium]|nr:rod shape-determining protein [Candidatus Equihabitans merdae]
MAQADIGIDLGSSNICVYKKEKGVVIKEPSLVAYHKDEEKILAFGEEARQMIMGKAGSVAAIRPMKAGVISDYAVTEALLKHYITKAMGHRSIRKPYISLCLPEGTTSIERRAVEEATYQAGARDVTIVDAPIAAAIGAGVDITKPVGNMIVDIGGGTTDISVISIGDSVVRESLKIAGGSFDEAIARYVRRRHSVFIDEGQAEAIKIKIGNAQRRPNIETMQVVGRNVTNGLTETIELTSEEIRQAIADATSRIVETVHGVLEKTPPELAADIAQRGIILTGGGSLLKGMEERISERTGINVMTATKPDLSVAIGTGLYTKMMEVLEEKY